MSLPLQETQTQWSSKFGFLMAAVGSSVGLGNLWRFSAEAGTNGGGAFIFIYLLCVIFIGMPVLMSEFLIGRSGGASSAVNSFDDIAKASTVSRFWASGAWIGMVASFLIVSFYCVVAAWVMAYIPKFIGGGFSEKSLREISEHFGVLVSSPRQVLPYYLLFAAITIFLVSRGLNQGIELVGKILMPLFFLLLIGLSVFSLISGWGSGGTMDAIKFLYTPDLSKITSDVAIGALGQAFFSLGIGAAVMITYGSYLPKTVSLPKSAIIVALSDSFVALIAGLAIFPIVFTYGLNFDAGAGLFFQTLPTALSQFAFGNVLGAAFFCLAIFAAITSSVSLLEPTVAHIAEQTGYPKKKAAGLVGVCMVIFGLTFIFYPAFMGFIDTGLTGPIMMPLSGLIVVCFVGWRLKRSIIENELTDEDRRLGYILLFLVRWVAPISVSLILIFGIYERYLSGIISG